jgi:D-alanyl-lipoteichoic acid acyltransferase DltB (MBOAT superfamily)
MLFNSLTFGVFFLIVLALHALLEGRGRTVLLLVSVVTNLGLLGFFKYFGFFLENVSNVAAVAGIELDPNLVRVILPVGISFYTFQTMSYTIDIYRGVLEPTDDFLEFSLFVTFFPQLVAGPIERARSLLPQLSEERRIGIAQVLAGVRLIAWGLFKKVFIADNLGRLIVSQVYNPAFDRHGLSVVLGTYAFAFQIYCDFSGYTDIARGCAKCLGIELRENFQLPYFARNPREFWSRWHISLSTWLRDYLYVSLGGNRLGRTKRNLMITMLLGGLWHGASWTFVLWGAYQGALLVGHRVFLEKKQRGREPRGRFVDAIVRFGFFQLVCIGWMIFRAKDVDHLGSLFLRMFDFSPDGHALRYLGSLLFYILPLLVVQMAQSVRGSMVIAPTFHPVTRGVFYVIFLWLFIVFGEFGGNQFIYFQF